MSSETEVFTIKGHRILEYLEKEPYVVDNLIAKVMIAERNDGNRTPEEELKKRIMDIILSFIEEGKIELREDRKLHIIETEDIKPILDGKRKQKIHPALDYNGSAYVGIYIPCSNGEDETEKLCLIDDTCNLFPVSDSNLSSRKLRIDSYPAKFDPRWSFKSIKCFLGGAGASAQDLFDSIKKQFQFYIDFPEKEAYDFFSLWIIGSYLHPVFQSYPYVYIGGLRESGKTKVLYLAYCLAFNSIFSSNMSASSLFRLIQSVRCVLLIDETEKLSNPQRAEEFRNILLGGYKSGSKVYRTEAKGRRELEVQAFEPYSPKMLANIRGLEDVLESRCISFILKRTLNKELGNREINEKDQTWQDIRDSLYIFALRHWKDIKEIYSSLENETELKNRDWELWKPVFAVAKFVSDELFEEMKVLAKRKVEEQKTENVTNTAECILAETLLETVTENRYYSIREITEAMRKKYEDEEKWLNNRWVGRALRRLGFSESRRVGTQREIKLAKDSVRDLAQRLGIEQSQTSKMSLTTSNNDDINDVIHISDVANDNDSKKYDFREGEAENPAEANATGTSKLNHAFQLVRMAIKSRKGGSDE